MNPVPKTLKAVLAALMLSLPLVGAIAPSLDEEGASPSPTNPGLVADLFLLAGIEEQSSLDLAELESWLGAQDSSLVPPSALHDYGVAALAGLAGAESALEAFRLAAAMNGIRLDPAQAPSGGTLFESVLTTYALLGVSPTPGQVLELAQSTGAASALLAEGLVTVLAGVNEALRMQAAGEDHEGAEAILQAVEDATPSLELAAQLPAPAVPPMAMSHSSPCDGTPVFVDPLGFIIVMGACDDVHSVDRLVQIDLGGNELYTNNAGGAADDEPGMVADPKVETERPILDVVLDIIDPILPIATFPLTEGIFGNQTPDGALLNATWQNETLMNDTWRNDFIASLPGRVAPFVANNSGVLEVPGILPGIVLNYTGGLNVDPQLNATALADAMPVALSLDLGQGRDNYSAPSRSMVQGAGWRGIGVLVDSGGDDLYTAKSTAQGSGIDGVGLLADLGGADRYTAESAAQGTADGGILVDLGTSSDVYSSGPASQAGHVVPFPTNRGMSVLLDAGGDDVYSSGSESQGAGGVLVDLLGDDSYTAGAGLFAQGASFVNGPGFLVDGAGSDDYDAQGSFGVQGFSAGVMPAALLDFGGGNDVYSAAGSMAQGVCTAIGMPALLFDEGGNDRYTAASGQGAARQPCLGALVDRSGRDSYESGDASQGASYADATTVNAPHLGALIDGGGRDEYAAGDNSQGSGNGRYAGLLVDASGNDLYTAGFGSQGSAGSSTGVGLLVDGLQDVVSAYADRDTEGGTFGLDAGAEAFPSANSGRDRFYAGDHSQGAGGTAGGTGLLLDLDDESTGGQPSDVALYDAGAWSQGASAAGGLGVLVNAEGVDRYIVPDAALSRGFADATGTQAGSFALLLELSGKDHYSGFVGVTHNDLCEQKGTTGLTVDMETPGPLPPGCDAVVIGAIANLVGFVTAPPPYDPSPCDGTEYFCDDVEAGDSGWNDNVESGNVGANQWRVVDHNQTAQPNGPDAYSGAKYWYVGAPGAPGVTYVGNDGETFLLGDAVLQGAYLVSPAINLTGATSPHLTARIAGSAEEGFDYLHVGVISATGTQQLTQLSGVLDYADLLDLDLSAYSGQTVQVAFWFTTDLAAEIGQGYNVDDVRVSEAI